MPIVTIQESAGRSREQRDELLARLTQAFVDAYGVPAESVTVFFNSYSSEDWGKAGKLAYQR